MTIVEVIVAAMVLALGAMATFGVLSSATKNTQRAKASQVALNRAQLEIETLRSLENEELALTSVPEHMNSTLDPNYRVNNANNSFALTREPPADYATLVYETGPLYGGGFVEGAAVDPGPTPFTSGDVTGKVYRYVVWRNDANCPAATCPGPQDYKEIVVAVKIDKAANQTAERGYAEVVSDFVDPTDSALDDPIPGANGVVSGQQFYFSDTPCAASGVTVRQNVVANHLLHNTLGTCAGGPQVEATPGAPDALLTGVPPDPDYLDDSNPALFDYSDDFYLEAKTAETDKGLMILRDTTSGCNYTPIGTTNPEARTHRWVTDPMSADFKMVDKVTLEFYTRTLNDESSNGELCVYLFKRNKTDSSDTRLTNKSTGNLYWTYNPGGTWWREKWKKERLTMTFGSSPETIFKGERLGVALSVERTNTTGAALTFMYDHPKYPTRLEVDTNTPIDGG